MSDLRLTARVIAGKVFHMNTFEVVDALGTAYRTREAVSVPLAPLVKALAGSCDLVDHDKDSWLANAFLDKLQDYEMGYLTESILENGLTMPLNILAERDGSFIMGNGHHRLIAALLCGIEVIDVVVSYNIDFSRTSGGDKPNLDRFEAFRWILEDVRSDVGSLLV